MHRITRRKLTIGFAAAVMTALSVMAVAPVGAQTTMNPNDAAVVEAQATLDGTTGSVAVGYPGPVFTATGLSASGSIPVVMTDPDGETSGTYQIDYSTAHDNDTTNETQPGS